MAETAIEWATHVWNPVTGCDRVSPGCAHCYALTYAGRLKAMGQPKYQRDGGKASGPGFGVTLHPQELDAPARWRKPRRVFVNSMSDLFHEKVDSTYIAAVWARMVLSPRHTFMVLTKRPERMRAVLRSSRFLAITRTIVTSLLRYRPSLADDYEAATGVREPVDVIAPLARNVWLGVTIENRRFVHRADLLRETPAAVRFISAEPLLGPLVADFVPEGVLGEWVWPDGRISDGSDSLDLAGIDWLIVGGESGPEHRRIDPQWVRDLRDAATTHPFGTRFFFKQWGGRTPKAGGRLLDGRTWDEMPRTRQEVAHA